MDPQLMDHLIVAGASFVAVVLATPAVKRLAFAIGAVKRPGERDIHDRATPEIGGLAILFGVVIALLAATRLDAFDELFRTTSEPESVVLAAAVITLVGLIDDTRSLGPGGKLAGQVLAAGVLVLFGLTINFVYIPFGDGGIFSLAPDAAALLTIVAVVAMINAVNLIDGLDGLAAGIVAIAAAALFVYTQFVPQGQVVVTPTIASASLVLAAIIGACFGFLVFNTHPASIFMGDTGSMLLGLLLAAAGVSAIGNTAEPTRSDFFVVSIPVLIPALVLALPFLDIALAIIRRLVSGQGIATPDRKHLHHRMVEIGNSQRQAVILLYIWSALLAVVVVGPAMTDTTWPFTVAGVGAVVLVLWTLGLALRRRLTDARAEQERRAVEDGSNIRRHPGFHRPGDSPGHPS
ncbi:glycosyltransferase family 4 protein [Euzebya tangerina]|uniref:glycosyltransferase family 4 protein n=1 Tax=Euzebya tangerina TaxID=591198 RepID=UPI000E32264A|nr:MraY family glycosyltransferase [Euzebya tangerina]